jgi:hypothetical protein
MRALYRRPVDFRDRLTDGFPDRLGNGLETELGESDDGDSPTWKAVVRYTPPNGDSITFASSLSSSHPSYKVGDTVPGLYVPNQPRTARIDDFGSLWFLPLLLGVIGLAFTVGGLWPHRGRGSRPQ